MTTPKIYRTVSTEVRHQTDGLRLSNTEYDVASCLVYFQAVRSPGRAEGIHPPSSYKSSLAEHFKPAELKFALLSLAAYGLVADHPDHEDAVHLTEAGVQFACVSRLARWGDGHLIGESTGPEFYVEASEFGPPSDPIERERQNDEIDAAIERSKADIELSFLRWGRMNWVAPDFLTK